MRLIASILVALVLLPTSLEAQVAATAGSQSSAPLVKPALTTDKPAQTEAAEPPRSGTWEAKDTVLAAGVVVTLFLGVWNAVSNHYFNKRTTFVNTVTAQRIKWIEQLRQDISTFSGLTYHWCHRAPDDPEESRKIIQQIDCLRHVIRLRLNPAGQHDSEIERLLDVIPQHTNAPDTIANLLEQLTKTTQNLLKDEWEKVKQESSRGPRSERA